jgi:hypothetical protein
MELFDPIGKLKGIGDKTEILCHKLGIFIYRILYIMSLEIMKSMMLQFI